MVTSTGEENGDTNPERQLEDPERKKKKEDKARLKESKKLKAAQKAEAAKAATKATQDAPKKKEVKAKKPAAALEDVVNPPTPAGEKKRLAPQMAASYSPSAVENSWYEWWEESGFFSADSISQKPPFVIVVPPPNVTGALHIGHGLTAAIQDSIVRWRRMKGYNTLWVPGTDHAGIATQVVVEKKIMREKGVTRHDMGREAFEAEVWKWKTQYGDTICKQQRRMGASLDWSRECFTMDNKLSKAVTEAFVRLYEEGLIYRDDRLVNWDCTLKTAISDIEVDYIEIPSRVLRKVPGHDNLVEFGTIISFAYPLEGGSGEIVVATTRPETMLGDTAVAVHPEDARYKHLHNKFVIHPFNGRKIPIILDAKLVDMEFGTGAVKITPAHDPNDYEVGKEHKLEFINIFTDEGKINSNGGKDYESLSRFDARIKVIKSLEDKGLYRGVADNPMKLGICSRSGDVVEPLVKPQWYVRCDQMAKEASEAVREGKLKILPKMFEDTWHGWLNNIRPWCISRQLWWGHRIPAWYACLEDDELHSFGAYNDEHHWVSGRDESEAFMNASKKYAGKKFWLEQDPDVLDTWFSSGLFPFSVLGWPEETADFNAFYPTSLLETGHDILFFWVARMVMLGMKLTNELPFKQVFLHAIVRDAQGRKMSKSLGNVIDPLEVISGVTLDELQKKLMQGNLDPAEVERASQTLVTDFPKGITECGTDALRFALVSYAMQPMKINLDIQRVVGYRQWCNKLWNAVRFTLTKLGSNFIPSKTVDVSSLPFSCKWILSVLNNTVARTNDAFESYDLTEATTAIYSWWQYLLCDVFIEVIKPVVGLNSDEQDDAVKKAAQDTLWICLDTGLRLLHPLMPFITEELWQRLPREYGETESIMVSRYPFSKKDWTNEKVEAEMELIQSVVKSARGLRMTYGLQMAQRAELFVLCKDDDLASNLIEHGVHVISTLASVSVEVLRDGEQPPQGCAVAIVSANVSVYLLLHGLVDAGLEVSKLKKRKDEILRQKETLSTLMSSAGYAKAPASVQSENIAKLDELATQLNIVDEATRNFEALVI